MRLPQPPAWLQRAGLALGAPLGRALGYRATYEPQAGNARAAGGLAMKRRFYLILLVLALVVLAVPGFAAKAAKRATRPALRFALRAGLPLPESAPDQDLP